MRRTVLMGLAVLSAAAMPLAASAGQGAPSAPGGAAVAQASSFTLGGAKCSLIKVPAAGTMPVGIGSCPGVRPGAEVQTQVGLCTLNFLFEAPDHERYIGTAGHCILGEGGPMGDNVGEKTWPKGQGPVAKDSAGSLPIGIARMVEVARAIVDVPKVLLLDEPTSGLEDVEMERLGALIQSIRGDHSCAVILVEHDVGFVMRQCQRIVVLDLGRVLAVGSPEEIQANTAVREAYLGEG